MKKRLRCYSLLIILCLMVMGCGKTHTNKENTSATEITEDNQIKNAKKDSIKQFKDNIIFEGHAIFMLKNNGKVVVCEDTQLADWQEIDEIKEKIKGIWGVELYGTMNGALWVQSDNGLFYYFETSDGWEQRSRIPVSKNASVEQWGRCLTIRDADDVIVVNLDDQYGGYYYWDSLPKEARAYGYNEGFGGMLFLYEGSLYNMKLKNEWDVNALYSDLELEQQATSLVEEGVKEVRYELYSAYEEQYTTLICDKKVVTYYYSTYDMDLLEINEPLKDYLSYPENCEDMYLEHWAYLIEDINSYYLLDGAIYCMGDNHWGQLGKDDVKSSTEYLKIDNAYYIDFYAGGHSQYALDNEGNVWTWGQESAAPEIIISYDDYV